MPQCVQKEKASSPRGQQFEVSACTANAVDVGSLSTATLCYQDRQCQDKQCCNMHNAVHEVFQVESCLHQFERWLVVDDSRYMCYAVHGFAHMSCTVCINLNAECMVNSLQFMGKEQGLEGSLDGVW